MRNKNYSKYLIALTAILLAWSDFAYAQGAPGAAMTAGGWVTGGLLKVIGVVIGAVLFTIGYIAAIFVTVGGSLTNMALDLNSQILSDSMVKIGWVVSRDIANLGFVFAIIVIAFATILRFESYAMKKILGKLIAAALLVNFSLVLAGVFVDFSGILTDFFLAKTTSNNITAVGEGLVNAIGAHRLFLQNDSESQITQRAQGLGDDFNAFINFIASLAIAVIFTVITAVTLISMAVMLYLRYFALVVLLILAPLAWLCWVWPDLEAQYKKWWSEFMKWIWFAPVVSFFVYLSAYLAISFQGGASFMNLESLNSLDTFIKDFGKLTAQMFAVVFTLNYGLVVANSMGIAGASAGFAVANKVKGTLVGATVGGAKYAGGSIVDRLRTIGYQEPKDGRGGGGWIQRTSAKLTGNPLIGTAASAVNQWATVGGKELVSNYQKEYLALAEDKDAFLNTANRPGIQSDFIRNPAKAAAYINVASEKGMLSDLRNQNPQLFGSLLTASREMGTVSKIFSRNPTLAGLGKIGKEKDTEIKKYLGRVSPADALNIPAEDFYNAKESAADPDNYRPTVLLNLTKQVIKKLSYEAKPAQSKAINEGIKAIKTAISSGKLKLEDDEQKNWEYLQNWDNDSIAAQTAKYEFGAPKPEKEIEPKEETKK